MSIYRVYTPAIDAENAEQGGKTGVVHQMFAASNKAVRAARKTLAEKHEVKPSDINVEPVDVRRGKAGMIAYLNGYHAQVPAGYEPEGYGEDAPAPRQRKKKSKPAAAKKKAAKK